MQTVLRADNIKVQFGGLVAVNDVSLALNQGQILGLIGPNGAGKSTLFNAITGFAPVAAGTVTFMEHDVTRLPPYVRTRLGMGRTFQTERPYEEMTVLENVLVAAFLKHPRRKDAEGVARAALQRVGLADRADQLTTDLNLARLRRLELAKALALEPRILFLDEIMAGLNPPALKEMIALLRTLTATGVSIVMVEHIMEAIIQLADHVIVLASGNKIAEGAATDVIHDENVIEAYLGTD
ncbi:ABC transporter ATP-binding protein [Bordetella genomosp. 7]|jgi:branched-chain amino acid transport system ATP-binding protein|uniref:ABC transporter ATP-binding protein n=1 Tax=Bordetella TaxID=517 RepID=UPI000479D347|nr:MULTISPECIES: ABC transporter ATP-binding protein [Bordetella]OZI24136.1 ABC transporter ATP-binding protein [Bordetella genomosp. 7]